MPTNETEQNLPTQRPTHWMDLEELSAQYWNDPAKQERRGQEFFDKPIETVEKLVANDSSGLARREFLTIMGASMAMATLACARRPVHKIIPYVIKPEQIVPGVSTWYASALADGTGVLVKTREGRPIKLEGNPEFPLTGGKLGLRAQATLLSLYDPERLRQPVSQTRGGGNTPLTWTEADEKIGTALKALREKKGTVRVLADPYTGPARLKVLNDFLAKFGSGRAMMFNALAHSNVSQAQSLSYGEATTPVFHFDKADVVVSLSGDFMSDGTSPTEHMRDWAKLRKVRTAGAAQSKMSRLIAFEPNMSLTGSNADERYSVRPGEEVKVAMALAHEIVIGQSKSEFSGNSGVKSVLAGFSAEKVAQEMAAGGSKVTAAKLKAIAHELVAASGRSLVVSGSLTSRSEQGIALQVAVNFLNSILGNEGKTVESAGFAAAAPYSEIQALINEMKIGKVDALVMVRTNPVYTLPAASGFVDALKNVKLVVAISDRIDESAIHADFVLPLSHALESWGDAEPRRGLFTLQQPTIAPLFDSRAPEENFLRWSGSEIAWHDALRTYWEKEIYSKQGQKQGSGVGFESFWHGLLQKGVLETRKVGAAGSSRKFRAAALEVVKAGKSATGVQLVLCHSESMHDGAEANNAWLQEVPDPVSTVTWDNCLYVSPALAKTLGVRKDDVVRVTPKVEGAPALELPVYIQPGQHPDVVSVAVGFGRTRAGNVAAGSGHDVFPWVGISNGSLVYAGAGVDVVKVGRRYELAATQAHHRLEGRPILNSMALDSFRKDPGYEDPALHEIRMGDKLTSIWPSHKYEGYRWGMSVDLNSCTGCNACVIACQAENNIPTVGRNNVRVSREMHWIRIDRYYAGDENDPEVLFQPMLCQHCENASCEAVCPVLATVHSSEGLNDMAYNRCVGTRYCQNNCPYKVRRFNFFDFWKDYKESQNLVWNPDVTVRTRGIMEKCTFCTQRIAEAKEVAKKAGTKVTDSSMKTACQQTCPTDAIVFGDINNKESQVSKLHAEAHVFRVYENLNNRPVIAYLSKVRNRPDGKANSLEGGQGHGH